MYEILLHGLPCLGAQTAHTLVRVIAGKCGQIHAGNRPEKPSRLPFLLHRSSRDLRLGTAFDCARVHANFLHPIQVERNSRVSQERALPKNCDRVFRERPETADLSRHFARCSGIMID
jgi:hypothetical protein